MRLQPGNTKLGMLIWNWSLPAGETCPGQTDLCAKSCYAKHGHYFQTNVINSLQRNYLLANSENFVTEAVTEIRRTFARIVRIHTAGDFYNAEYTQKWLDVVRLCKDVNFYAYTRSWRLESILPRLKLLSKQSNMVLWLSCDKETGAPPRGFLRSYMSTSDDDVPAYPVDLVFRTKRFTERTHDAKGNLICAYERGAKHKTSCSDCRICWDSKLCKTPKQKPKKQLLVLSP